jgi:hypothetical protein
MKTYGGLSRFVATGDNNPNKPISTIFRTQDFTWNMDTTNNITVNINKRVSEIDPLVIGGVLWNDAKTQFYPIGLDRATNKVFISSIDDQNTFWQIILVRQNGGPLDNINFSNVVNPRGWLLVQSQLTV